MDVHEDCTIYVHFCTEYLAEDGIQQAFKKLEGSVWAPELKNWPKGLMREIIYHDDDWKCMQHLNIKKKKRVDRTRDWEDNVKFWLEIRDEIVGSSDSLQEEMYKQFFWKWW